MCYSVAQGHLVGGWEQSVQERCERGRKVEDPTRWLLREMDCEAVSWQQHASATTLGRDRHEGSQSRFGACKLACICRELLRITASLVLGVAVPFAAADISAACSGCQKKFSTSQLSFSLYVCLCLSLSVSVCFSSPSARTPKGKGEHAFSAIAFLLVAGPRREVG